MLEKVSEDFEGLHSNAFALRGHELVDYPGIDTSSESWQQHTCLDRIKYCPVDEWALHWLADNHFHLGEFTLALNECPNESSSPSTMNSLELTSSATLCAFIFHGITWGKFDHRCHIVKSIC